MNKVMYVLKALQDWGLIKKKNLQDLAHDFSSDFYVMLCHGCSRQ